MAKSKKMISRFPTTKTGKVKGTTSDFLSLDDKTLNSLNRNELAGIVSKLADVFNKRLPRLEKEGSVSYTNVMEGGGRFSAKGKSRNELLKEYSREKMFSDNISSTVAGTRQIRKEFAERVDSDGILSAGQFGELWKIYNELQKDPTLKTPFSELKNVVRSYSSSQIQKEISELILSGKSKKRIKSIMKQRIVDAMKKQKKEEEKFNEEIWSL